MQIFGCFEKISRKWARKILNSLATIKSVDPYSRSSLYVLHLTREGIYHCRLELFFGLRIRNELQVECVVSVDKAYCAIVELVFFKYL